MADDRRRIAKLETRAREAEMALQQLKAYIQLLKDKGNGVCIYVNNDIKIILKVNK